MNTSNLAIQEQVDRPISRIALEANQSRLTLDKHGGLAFLLNGKYLWSSDGPLLVLHYYDRQHPRAQVATVPSGNGCSFGTAGTPSLSAVGQLLVESDSNTSLAICASFENIEISLRLHLSLREDGRGFSIRLDDEAITENHSKLYRVLAIECLPNFGAARTGESGYLTLPNWVGCQTFFDKSYPREIRQTIYSSNDQWEHVCNMPIFGITRAQGTLCGLVAQGDYDAQLVCRVHWEEAQINGIYPCLIYRWQQQDEPVRGNREIQYTFASPDYEHGEGYVFCGKTYREFLRTQRGLLTWKEKAETRPVVTEYRDRFFLKILMAFKDPQPDGLGPYHATCTFGEAREILQACLDRGMKNIMAILVGWGQDGHDGMPPTRFPVDERLGGEKEMKKLNAWCKEQNILLGVHDSYGEVYACSSEFDTEDLLRHRTGEYWESVIWSGGQAHKACPKMYVEKYVMRDVPAVRSLGIYGHHHLDAVGSFMTCFSEHHPLERRADYVQEVRRMFKIACEEMGSVSTELPFGPYFDVVDGFYHSYSDPYPWHRASSVGRYFLDRTIPLLSIVMHGSANCHESLNGLKKDPLHWVDWGLSPQSEVCMRPSPTFGVPSYDSVADMLGTAYEFYYGGEKVLPRLGPLTIEGRWEIAPAVSTTKYSDGTIVRVNLGDDSWGDLAARSFKIDWAT